MPTYTVTSDPLTVDDAASTLVQVQNTGTQPIRIAPLGRTVAVGATVTVPGWLTVPTAIHTVGGGATSTAVVTLTAGSPATAPGPGPFLVDPGAAGTMSLSITGGTWYSDEGLKTAISFPTTISAVTSIYPVAEASVTVSATVGTVTKTVGHSIRAGDGGSFTWIPTTEAERVATAVAAAASAGSVPDADASTKGKVQLTGHLGGTAASPTVTGTSLAAALPLAQGGTAATTAGAARTSLGLGTAATMTPETIAADTALTSMYGRFSLARQGRVIAWAGDSITVGAGASQLLTAFITIVPKITGNTLLSSYSTNAGVAGNASTELLARFPTILADGPDGVHVQIGVNDAATSMPLSTFSANIIAMRALADAAGIPLTMGTVFPQGSARGTTIRDLIRTYNLWLLFWAPRAGVLLADTFGALVDPATGYLSAANDSGDHIHPSDAGHAAIAIAIAAMFTANLKARPWPVVTAGAGLMTDPLMAANPGAVTPSATTTISLVAASGGDVPVGGWKRFTTTNATGSTVFEWVGITNFTTGFTAGDVLLLAMYLRGDAAETMNKVQFFNQDFVPRSVMYENAPSATPGPLLKTFTVPAGDTTLYLEFVAQTPASDTSTFDIGACDVFNLTTLGLASLVTI